MSEEALWNVRRNNFLVNILASTSTKELATFLMRVTLERRIKGRKHKVVFIPFYWLPSYILRDQINENMAGHLWKCASPCSIITFFCINIRQFLKLYIMVQRGRNKKPKDKIWVHKFEILPPRKSISSKTIEI